MSDQKFLQDLDAKLWKSANKLLPSLDAAVYKHVVLGCSGSVFPYITIGYSKRLQPVLESYSHYNYDHVGNCNETVIKTV